MVVCNECGIEVEDGRVVCPGCGSILVNQKGKRSVPQNDKAQKREPAPKQAPIREQKKAAPKSEREEVQAQARPVQEAQPAPIATGNETVTVGEWFLMSLITMIPCVNIIMLFIWAFGKNVKPSKRNYCRYVLIMSLILIIGMVVFMVVAGASAAALLSSFSSMPLN